jgi:hypothetical protein
MLLAGLNFIRWVMALFIPTRLLALTGAIE